MSGADSVRLFVALELPAAVRSALSRWAREHAARLGRLRLVDPESLHVTLCFLGARPVAEVAEISTACRAAVAALPAPELVIGDALWLPPRRPRVLTIELTDSVGRLAALQSALSAALAAAGVYTPETRPFLAHVTTARVKGESRGGAGARSRPEPPPAPDKMRFTSSDVTLYQSHLGKGPAHYQALTTVELHQT